jgi:hypothetical protein
VEGELAPSFEGKTVKVTIRPHGKSKPGTTYIADGAPYSVDANSEWAALIDPTGSSTNAVTWSSSTTEDHKSGESEEDGAKVHAGVDTSTKVKEAEKFVQSFNESLKVNVQTLVKLIEEDVISANSNESKIHSKETTWTIGVGSADKKKNDEAAETKRSSGGGLVERFKRGISSGAKWLYNQGKGIVKKIPLIGTALDVAGDIWDKLTGNVKIERKSVDAESETKGGGASVSLKDAREIHDMTAIAHELTTQFTAETSKEIETMVSTKLGVELSKTKKMDSSAGKSTMKGASGSTVTVETGQPKVLIKRLK